MAHVSAPRRINEIARRVGARSYLEIGVQAGKTFFNVDIPVKVAVDPNFLFDYKEHASGGVIFYNCTSDDFFSSVDSIPNFDIVFLDGLHTFDQTYRDFCNALLFTHDRSIIIIDDTVPNDYYSSLRSQSSCVLRRRREAPGSTIGEWRGDVYKVTLLLTLFHGSLGFITANDEGPAQTIVWRKHGYPNLSKVYPPTINQDRYELLLEYLYRLPSIDFDWLLSNKAILNCFDFNNFISLLSQDNLAEKDPLNS